MNPLMWKTGPAPSAGFERAGFGRADAFHLSRRDFLKITLAAAAGINSRAAALEKAMLLSEQELVTHVFDLARNYFADFQHPQTGVLYDGRLSTKAAWTSAGDVKAGKPQPWGYGSRICDTALHCGHTLVALLDAHEARPDPFLREHIRKLVAALRFIGSLSAIEGLVPRGPHPDDVTAFYDDSSMDQHTTFIIALARYAGSALATEEEKRWIGHKLQKVGERLEQNGWSIKRADGLTQAHVGFPWTGMSPEAVSILLPAVMALFKGTGDPHWQDVYQDFCQAQNGKRWEIMAPGAHTKINAHPIYANQNCFRLNALFQWETNARKKAIVRALLEHSARLQLARDFPNDFYKAFYAPGAWENAARILGWKDDVLHGCVGAWSGFDPSFIAPKAAGRAHAIQAHVRFPLGGFHMVLQSCSPALIDEHLPRIWQMLTTVDLKQIESGETNYLFTTVGMHVYSWYFSSRKK